MFVGLRCNTSAINQLSCVPSRPSYRLVIRFVVLLALGVLSMSVLTAPPLRGDGADCIWRWIGTAASNWGMLLYAHCYGMSDRLSCLSIATPVELHCDTVSNVDHSFQKEMYE